MQVEQSLKYDVEEAGTLWQQAGLKEVSKWSSSVVDYSKFIFTSYLIHLCHCYFTMREDYTFSKLSKVHVPTFWGITNLLRIEREILEPIT